MLHLSRIESPFLRSSAQVYVLPINSHAQVTSVTVDKFNGLFPKNFNLYQSASVRGELRVGSTLLYTDEGFNMGLMPPVNTTRPDYIANLVYNTHPVQAPRVSWLNSALADFMPMLSQLITDKGINKVAVYAKDLVHSLALAANLDEAAVIAMIQQQFATLVLSQPLQVDIHLQ